MPRVLVVEDEDLIREMLVEVLDEAGFKTIEAATADHAACLLEEACPWVIVTDINLPGQLDGIAFAQRVRQKHPPIPVLFISGRTAKLEEARIVPHPVAFLAKPFTFAAFLIEVQALAAATWRGIPDQPATNAGIVLMKPLR